MNSTTIIPPPRKSEDRTNGYGFPEQEQVKLANGNAYQDVRQGTSPHQLRGGRGVHLHDPVTVKA
jgi:hypothetical protein